MQVLLAVCLDSLQVSSASKIIHIILDLGWHSSPTLIFPLLLIVIGSFTFLCRLHPLAQGNFTCFDLLERVWRVHAVERGDPSALRHAATRQPHTMGYTVSP